MGKGIKGFLLGIALLYNPLYSSTVIDDFLFQSQKKLAKYSLDIDKFDRNYIDKARLSVEHSHFSDLEREYAVRVYTKSKAELDNQEDMYNLKKSLYHGKRDLEVSDLLKSRYMLVLEAMYLDRERYLLDEEISLQKLQYKFEKTMIKDNNDIVDIYGSKQNIERLKLQKKKSIYRYEKLLGEIHSFVPYYDKTAIKDQINQYLFVSPSSLLKRLFIQFNTDTLLDEVILQNSKDKIALAEEKLKSMQIKNYIKLDNIEIKFDDSKKRKNALSLGISVEIPIAQNSLNYLDERLKVEAIKHSTDVKIQRIEKKIESVKDDIHYLLQHLKDIKLLKYSQQNISHIALSLKVKKEQLKLKKLETKTLYQVLKKYIQLLYLTGSLDDYVYKNLIFQKVKLGE